MPGGALRRMELLTVEICAIAAPISVPGWKYTFRMPMPGIDWLSIRSIPFTVVEYARSLMNTTRRSMSSVVRPG